MEPFFSGFWTVEEKLPILETCVGSLAMPVEQALRELGYANPEELRAMRAAEDLMDDPRVKELMAIYLVGGLESDDETIEQQIKAMQDMIAQLSELIKGTPSIVARLKDKPQASRKDKRQPNRQSRHYWTTEAKVWSPRAGMWRWVEGPWDGTIKRPYDMTYDLEHSLGIR